MNAAYRYLCSSGVLGERDPDDVIVAVLDADGRLAPNALIEVAPFFADPAVGGVQIGVRMYNAGEKLLARMQDFEFVTFTEIFQRARQRIGSVGLGGNGQFNRLSALRSLGSAPWTKCLTEDLDLGIQLLTRGWLNCYCPTSHVSQQAVVQFRRLVRQRSRWYQGNLQCWGRIPEIVRSSLPTTVVIDLLFQLLASSLILIMSVASVAFLATFGLMMARNPQTVDPPDPRPLRPHPARDVPAGLRPGADLWARVLAARSRQQPRQVNRLRPSLHPLRLHVGPRRMAGRVADAQAPGGLGQDNSDR